MFIRGLPLTVGSAIGATPISGGTVGSVLFVGTGSVIQQDNANFFWDDTNNQLLLGVGTALLPAYSFSGDANTGAYQNGADIYAIATAGVLRASIDATGDVIFTQGVSTSGSPAALTLTGGAHTTLAAGVQASAIVFNLAQTVQFATGALATQRAVRIEAPTYGFVAASTLTTASTLYVSGAPIQGTNATITNAYALEVAPDTDSTSIIGRTAITTAITDVATLSHFDQRASTTQYNIAMTSAGNLEINGAASIGVTIASATTVWSFSSGFLTATGTQVIANDEGSAALPSYSFTGDLNTGAYQGGADIYGIATAGAERMTIDATGDVIFTQGVSTSGSPAALTVTGAAHTTLAAGVQASAIVFNLAQTVQFATGALATQRAVRIEAPTYGFVGASTITTAATVYISGAPVAGTNATITSAYSLWIDAGLPRIDSTTPNALVATVLGSVGPTGANTTVQEWLTIDINGTTRYIPCF